MKNYQEWYEKRKSSLLRHPQLLQLMRIFNRMMTVLMPVAYLALLGTSLISKGTGQALYTYILVPAFGFVLLTLVRKWINQPRPYETWEIIPLLDKDSSGNSMPSRHVFSATIISMACLHANLPVGLVLLVLSALLGLVRVLGGVHYPKDVFSRLCLWSNLGNSFLYFLKSKASGLGLVTTYGSKVTTCFFALVKSSGLWYSRCRKEIG